MSRHIHSQFRRFGASLEMAEDGCQRWHAESGGVANNAVALAVQSALPLVENSEQAEVAFLAGGTYGGTDLVLE